MNRDLTIDYLRFIGLTFIILAHVQPPEVLFNVRCFDVCMMLFVSGLAFSGRRPDFSLRFLANRAMRLIVPVYLFLTCYFLAVALLKCIGIDFGVRSEHVIGSYLLMEGIGYVWIIRVFLLVALLTPFLLKLDKNVGSPYLLVAILLAGMLLAEMLMSHQVGYGSLLVREYIYYAIGYSVLFVLGLRIRNCSKYASFGIFSVLLLLFIASAVRGGGILTTTNIHQDYIMLLMEQSYPLHYTFS